MSASASILENARVIARLGNALIRARQEKAKIQAKLFREHSGIGPFVIPEAGSSSDQIPSPPGLTDIEWKQKIKALRSAIERFSTAGIHEEKAGVADVPAIESGLRGMEETQSFDLLWLKGGLIDRLV